MSMDFFIAGVVVVALLFYLVYTLVFPEEF